MEQRGGKSKHFEEDLYKMNLCKSTMQSAFFLIDTNTIIFASFMVYISIE